MWKRPNPQSRLADALQRADRARNKGRFAAASKEYAEALRLMPGRNDIRVQMANMLKDSGQFAAAEAAYLAALEEDPSNADTSLQLGHLHNISGKRAAAVAAYRRALRLDPFLAPALRELAAAGESAEQLIAFEMQTRHGGTEALLTIRSKLDEIAGQIAEIRERMPDALASAAFPIEAYTEFRHVFDLPPPGGSYTDEVIAVVLLADREPLAELHALVFAILDQTHQNWKLLAIGRDPDRRAIVERAAAADPRISWCETARDVDIGVTELDTARRAGADWVLLLALSARPHRHAFAWIAQTAARTRCDAIVFDEEIGELSESVGELRPILRHTIDYDTLREANVYGETVAVTVAALGRLPAPVATSSVSMARSELLLNLSRAARVAHVPLPLFRTPPLQHRSPNNNIEDHAAALRSHFGVAPRVSPWSDQVLQVLPVPSSPDVPLAVIIPTKDNVCDLRAFINSLISLAARPERLEILVLNNGALLPRNALERQGELSSVDVRELPEPFNWSRFSNLGAQATTAPYLLFANDDMLMLTEGWDDVVRALLERPDVGAVGARLLYPDDTVQHAGVLFDWHGSAIHDGLYHAADDGGPALRWHTTRSVSAVTGAFLATRRANFVPEGGFDEGHLAISYSDVDYSLKLRARGLRILWTPMVTLYHHESKTRGLDHLDPTKAARDVAERRVLRARWRQELARDPSMNPFWHQATLPHRLIHFPSGKRIWSYITTSAQTNPWAVSPQSDQRL